MLIEIVVAIGIIGLVLVGVSDLMTRSINVSTFQKQKDEAITIIKKMLTDKKTERDQNPVAFYDQWVDGTTTLPPDRCVPEIALYSCEVTVNKATEAIAITVRAEWQEGDVVNKTNNKTYSASMTQSFSREVR